MATALVIALISSVIRLYSYETIPMSFNCRAQVYVWDEADFLPCTRRSSSNFFFAMKEDGTGYIIISGSSTCEDEKQLVTQSETINFTYTEEGDFYSLTLGPRDVSESRIAKVLTDEVIKIKISKTKQ
ncbi:Uncharacterised protein [Serratia fonticola]|uniref:Uncharacterized protein n=1 Tax=Serratia fonticola TaxID=47917 RepID=A0A4V6KUB5_SERFO|nr:Uncharacterised protein [Serratia fonticola]